MMAMLFATYIVKGTKTFADVPPLLRTQVAKILIEDFDLASAVPTAFGGTLAQ